jgi:hypothetical protein
LALPCGGIVDGGRCPRRRRGKWWRPVEAAATYKYNFFMEHGKRAPRKIMML